MFENTDVMIEIRLVRYYNRNELQLILDKIKEVTPRELTVNN